MNQKRSALTGWIVCFAIYLCCGLPILVSPVVQTLADAYPEVQLNTVRSIVTIPSLMGFVLALPLASRVGKLFSYRNALLTGLVLCLIGGVLPAFFNQHFCFILAARVLFGMGFAMFSMRNAYTTRYFGDDAAAAWMGYGLFIQNACSVVLQLISGRLGDIDWRYSFLLYFVISAALVIAFLLYREPEDRDVPAKPEETKRKKAGLPLRSVIYALIPLLGTLCTFPILSSASVFIHERGLGTAAESSLVASAYTVGSALNSVFFGRVYRRLGRYTVSVGCAITTLGFVLILAASHVTLAAAGSAICGGGFSWILLVCSNWAKDAADADTKAVSMTMVTSFVSGGAFLSSYYMAFARWAGSAIPLFETEMEKTFLVSVILYVAMGVVAAVRDLRPSAGRES